MPLHDLELEATPESAAVARQLTRAALSEAAVAEELADDIVLLTSEIVTNAVLHGDPPLHLRIIVDHDYARVEVEDGHPELPSLRPYATDAPTGRGLGLVAQTATAWGSERSRQGKIVWFEMGRAERSRHRASSIATPSAAPASDARLIRVEILRLPVAVYMEAQAHNDALMREFALIAAGHGAQGVPQRLLDVMEEVRSRFGRESAESRRQIRLALDRGDAIVDLHLDVPPEAALFGRRLAGLLDEADEFCAAGDLLTLATTPTVRRFRAWYLAQVGEQVAGGPPRPWS